MVQNECVKLIWQSHVQNTININLKGNLKPVADIIVQHLASVQPVANRIV
jgi:hypothetical protein